MPPVPPDPDHPAARSRAAADQPGADRAGPGSRRADARHTLAVRALVAIPALPTRTYAVQEISRGGMFLSFLDARTTRGELVDNGIERGTAVELAFVAPVGDERSRIGVRARIVRITPRGLAVEFVTRNPPQLARLRELFASAIGQGEVHDATLAGED